MTKNSDERRSARANVLLVAAVECEGRTIPVRVANLSAHGALVFSDGVPREDTPVIFRCNGIAVDGWVAWLRPPHAGIHFSNVIQPGNVLRKAPDTKALIVRDTRTLDFRRPGLRGNQLTRPERQIVAEWTEDQKAQLGK
jgi:hypothetical protein